MKIQLLISCLIGLAAFADFAPEPEGYHDEPYRGLVPQTLNGATVINTQEAHQLWETGAAKFVDVLPHDFRPKLLPEDALWIEKKRLSIEGSTWLPNVGYAMLADVTDEYFRAGLSLQSEGNLHTPFVFFCLNECWMSWNAAKRAMEYGYSDVLWYPEGTDGWADAGYDLVQNLPWDATGGSE